MEKEWHPLINKQNRAFCEALNAFLHTRSSCTLEKRIWNCATRAKINRRFKCVYYAHDEFDFSDVRIKGHMCPFIQNQPFQA